MTHAQDPQDPPYPSEAQGPQDPQDAVPAGDTRMELPLRGVVRAMPIAAVVVTVMWGYTVFAVVRGGNNAALSGALMSLLGLLLLFVTVTYCGYLVRPLTLGADRDGVSVRLPLLAERTIPWDDVLAVRVAGVRAGQFLIVEARASSAGALPYVSRPRAAYRRFSLMTGSAPRVKQGLCFETYVFAFALDDALRMLRAYAPPTLYVEDLRR
ncbi:PH domain-containing protein [Streptomyces cremeus]|uniref:PH domain-containing protein n=1 Tax=Streptomyces cremeus TaxID=66881 RepID=A0ABV5PMV2_STRCM